MKYKLCGLLAAGWMALAMPAWAQQAAQDEEQQTEEPSFDVEKFIASLHFEGGEIAVPEAQARFRLNPSFRYLGATDARRVLEDLWGNPPNDSVLGLIVPAQSALDEEDSWAVVVTYSDDGYVSDADAAKIDYTELLAQMQQDTRDANAERKKEGYRTMNLVGWAAPPHYDASGKRLYWAKELAVEDFEQHTLNYNIRVLGRRGYLSLNAVAGMSELAQVQQGMQQLLPMAEFDTGARYTDYNKSTDRLAAYGIATLIGGGLAAKAGLFAKLGLLLVKFWKLGLIGIVALGAGVKRLFGGDKRKNPTVQ
jgi:uncharacterized membrane-anchored protein